MSTNEEYVDALYSAPKLDPEPWVCGMKPNQDVRHEDTFGCSTPVWAPREGYSQDGKDYA